MPIELPTGLNTPPQDIAQYVIMLAGEKKIGKTSFASQFPNHLILECEPRNAIHLKCRFIDIGNWSDFVQTLKLLEQNRGYAKTLCIDDIPTLHNYCTDHICRNLGISHPSEQAYGKGWGAVDSEFQRQLNRLHSLGMGIIYTAHTKTVEEETRSGRKFNRIETYGGAGCIRWLDAKVHLWAVMLFDGEGGRELVISGDDYIKAANGLSESNFTNQFDQKPLRYIPMGQSSKEGYENFVKAFNNQLTVPPKQQLQKKNVLPGLPTPPTTSAPKFTFNKK